MALLRTINFYGRYGFFQLKERFSDVGQSLSYLLLYPLLILVLTAMWNRFNAYQGNYTREEIYVYIAIAELLFLTFLRSAFLQRSQADFSMGLARPRSWLGLTFAGQFGATLGGRCLYVICAVPALLMVGVSETLVSLAFLRLVLLLPILGVMESLMASILASAQLLWQETRYLVLPITKIFLALGGVFCPLADYGEPGRSIFLQSPASDLFFQVGHYCLKGEFYQLSGTAWSIRIGLWLTIFGVTNVVFFHYARKRHQSWGG
ncbi:MAG TPA: hypothetical protein VE954_33040 [Oligoflexus sp.]|uniref:hypothetical protein n=1 Tax=Oligoflexus sp. TaxID=1971216 RepID=UPI002D5BA3EC|nr:hypothetical protein [Oligoflexus sp.]HYX37952.1 hypothetical protein [Oligoflexus sp.]